VLLFVFTYFAHSYLILRSLELHRLRDPASTATRAAITSNSTFLTKQVCPLFVVHWVAMGNIDNNVFIKHVVANPKTTAQKWCTTARELVELAVFLCGLCPCLCVSDLCFLSFPLPVPPTPPCLGRVCVFSTWKFNICSTTGPVQCTLYCT
jgi:hypothetical protein